LGGLAYSGIATDNEPKKLTDIEMIAPTGKVVKKVTFQQSYFNEQMINSENAVDYMRLKLDGFKVYDQQYSFKYKCDDALPEKHSKSTDFWGFYNGMNNSRRLPYINFADANLCKIEGANIFNPNNELSRGAIKGSSFCDALIGSILEIRYPTGGTTKFNYESNEVTLNISDNQLNADDFNYPYLVEHNIAPDYPKISSGNNYQTFAVGGLRVKSITNFDKDDNPLLKKSYDYSETLPSGEKVASGKLMDAFSFFRTTMVVSDFLNVIISGIVVNSNNSFGTSASAMGSYLGYSQVSEIIEDKHGNLNNGKIISTYINELNTSLVQELDGSSYMIETTPYNYQDANGKILRQEIYSQNNHLKQLN
jgi:hypothetical protein